MQLGQNGQLGRTKEKGRVQSKQAGFKAATSKAGKQAFTQVVWKGSRLASSPTIYKLGWMHTDRHA